MNSFSLTIVPVSMISIYSVLSTNSLAFRSTSLLICFLYSVISSILKIIVSIFEMFYLCCYEIKTIVEFEIKVVTDL